ncbi:MAG TPA: hypothetical protein VKJ65_07065 [Phycisphaerae bacterium]|nr:hypothetical protein [Phycisphaerae bacterium]
MVNVECLLETKLLCFQAQIQILVPLHNELPKPPALSASTEGVRGGQKSQWRIAGRLHTFYDAKSYRQVSSLLQGPHYICNECLAVAKRGSTLIHLLHLSGKIK